MWTHPTNLREVTTGCFPSAFSRHLKVRKVTNFQHAFSPGGVLAVSHVLRQIPPDEVPVARTPNLEYSLSWKDMDEMMPSEGETLERSSLAIRRALIVWRHNHCCEHVAM